MDKYYAEKLSAEKLRRCYEIAPPRIQQYLDSEIEFVRLNINHEDRVIELGCGYGRVLPPLCQKAKLCMGIDNSLLSLKLAQEELSAYPNLLLATMNAADLAVADNSFHLTICIQNGLSAFKVDKFNLLKEALRITKSGGKILLSTYSENFWNDRLHWFELQSQHGLLGEIDYEKTSDGIIICRDGFKANTISPIEFRSLAAEFNLDCQIKEIDNSSLFCIIDT